MGGKGNRGRQTNAGNVRNIRKVYHLAFTIAMKSCIADLCIFAQGNRRVFVVNDEVVQKKLWSDAEGKDQQHHSA